MRLAQLAPRQRIATIFFLHALAQGGLFSRIPDLQQALGLDASTLGLTLLGQPLGGITMFLFASVIVERVGTRRVLVVAIPALALCVFLMAVVPSAVLLFIVFAVYGALFGASNISMNVEADRVEAATGQRVMNTCHGVWSLGMLVATLLGTVARGGGVAPALHFVGILLPIAIATLLVIVPLQPAPPRPHAGTALRRRLALPTLMIFCLVGYAVAGALVEGSVRHWSVIYMGDSFAAPDWVDTLTLPAFLVAQTGGRMFADRVITRFGPVAVARAGQAACFFGLLLVALAPSLWTALAGFLLIGLGTCVAFPLVTSAAAQLGDRPSSENVASLTLVTQIVLLGAPAAMGYLADAFGLRLTYAMLLPFIMLAFYLARYLAPRPAAAPALASS